MGERGSAHRASVIRIFACAGYKRDEQGRFVLSLGRVDGPRLLPLLALRARVDRNVHFTILVPFFLLFPWRRVLARAVDPRRSPSSNLHRRLASREHFPAIVDDDRGRAGTKARAHFATTRPERAALPGRRNREVATFFSFGFYVQVRV